MEAALPWDAEEPATTAIKLCLGFERRVKTSWLKIRYRMIIPRVGMSLVIQEAPTTGNSTRGVPIHIYIPEALSTFARGRRPRFGKELRGLLMTGRAEFCVAKKL